MSRYLVNARNRAESTEQSRFPPARVGFCSVSSRAQVAFSSEPSRNLLCATILDIISTSCAYVLSLRRARSPPRYAARDRAAPCLSLLGLQDLRAKWSTEAVLTNPLRVPTTSVQIILQANLAGPALRPNLCAKWNAEAVLSTSKADLAVPLGGSRALPLALL